LIANAVKAQLGGGYDKTHLYIKTYTKTIDALRMPYGYQPPKFNQFYGKGNPNSMSLTSLRRAVMLAQRETGW